MRTLHRLSRAIAPALPRRAGTTTIWATGNETAPVHVFRAVTVTLSQQRQANVIHNDGELLNLWFTSSRPSARPTTSGEEKARHENQQRLVTLAIQTLHDRLPDLLASPLPQDILSPSISLHLFPSTHPHLPTVSGKLGYTAALWTAPVAWGRVPVVGNVKLVVLSERMVHSTPIPASTFSIPEKERLIVRWRTCGKTKGLGVGSLYKGISGNEPDGVDKITEFLGGDERDDRKEFCGLFIFEFDEQGRILKHTIEHAQENSDYDKMTRVVSVTDWLLGKARRKDVREKGDAGIPELALCTFAGRDHRRPHQRH